MDDDQRAQDADAARVTYRYLRLGLVGAVVLVAVSILTEHVDSKADCFQRSVSAYYYTPVRAIFAGALFAIGFALIVIQGRGWIEDCSLNFAGILALIVAVVPTTNVGNCSLATFDHDPVKDGAFTPWVVRSVDNNVLTLLITASLGILCGIVFVVVKHHGVRELRDVAKRSTTSAKVTLTVTFLFVAGLWIAYYGFRDDFYKHAHMLSATFMVVFLGIAVGRNAWQHSGRGEEPNRVYFWLYTVVVALMAASAIGALAASGAWAHWVLGVESLELLWFATFWIAQTVEHWSEQRLLT